MVRDISIKNSRRGKSFSINFLSCPVKEVDIAVYDSIGH